MFLGIVCATGMLLKVKGGWDAINLLQEKNNFTSLLRNIRIKAHFPLESPFRIFGYVIIQIICCFANIIHCCK